LITGSAVVTTRLSSAVMKIATELRAKAQSIFDLAVMAVLLSDSLVIAESFDPRPFRRDGRAPKKRPQTLMPRAMVGA
jgi:hypothetical protein